MRFPYGSGSWYNAQKYGTKTSYGYHEGDDFNLTSGGDSDLGQPLYAIADGEVTSVHIHTTKPTFGRHIHIRHDGEWGTVYSHYAHLDAISVKTGDVVKEGQQIGTLGKSGTDAAHLHFAIKNQPTGIDGIARTLDDLKKWENPTEFINKWKGNMSDSISIPKKTFEELVGKATKLDNFRTTLGSDSATEVKQWIEELKKEISAKNTEIKAERERADRARGEFNELVQAAAKALNTVQEPNQIISALSKLEADLDRLDDLERQYAELQVLSGKEKEDLEAEIARLKALVQHGDIKNYTTEELIGEIIKRIQRILLRR